MFRKLIDVVTQERYYEDSVTRIQYRRAVCALAWPWYPAPGCTLVLAERRALPNRLNVQRHVDVMAETISEDLTELLESAKKLMKIFYVRYLLTPVDDDRHVHIEYENDKLREDRRPLLRTQHPMTWHGHGEGLLPYYISLIRRRIVEQKTLHFSEYSQLPTDIRAVLGREDSIKSTVQTIQHPSLCALCWCLEDIDANRGQDDLPYDRILVGAADRIGGY